MKDERWRPALGFAPLKAKDKLLRARALFPLDERREGDRSPINATDPRALTASPPDLQGELIAAPGLPRPRRPEGDGALPLNELPGD